MGETDQRIECPHCRGVFPLSDALAHQIEERIRRRYEERARGEAERIEREARRRVEEELGARVEGLSAANAELTAEVRAARKKELELLQARARLERREEELALEVERRLADERARVRDETRRQAEEAGALALREKEKLIGDLRAQMEEMKRRVEQGSQQAQGEILEVELERLLRERFPGDRIEPVAKGTRGADVLHEVISGGLVCGRILWESKRTKAWGGDWVAKLKEDRLRAKADLAAIVSTVLPREIRHFGELDGVWVCDVPTAVGMATCLRAALVETAAAQRAMVGRADKMQRLYKYLIGPEFRQRIDGLMSTFKEMRRELDQEQAAVTRMWARREKQIQQFVDHTARMYGDLQGIGAGLPEIPGLALPGEQLPLLGDGEGGERC